MSNRSRISATPRSHLRVFLVLPFAVSNSVSFMIFFYITLLWINDVLATPVCNFDNIACLCVVFVVFSQPWDVCRERDSDRLWKIFYLETFYCQLSLSAYNFCIVTSWCTRWHYRQLANIPLSSKQTRKFLSDMVRYVFTLNDITLNLRQNIYDSYSSFTQVTIIRLYRWSL